MNEDSLRRSRACPPRRRGVADPPGRAVRLQPEPPAQGRDQEGGKPGPCRAQQRQLGPLGRADRRRRRARLPRRAGRGRRSRGRAGGVVDPGYRVVSPIRDELALVRGERAPGRDERTGGKNRRSVQAGRGYHLGDHAGGPGCSGGSQSRRGRGLWRRSRTPVSGRLVYVSARSAVLFGTKRDGLR